MIFFFVLFLIILSLVLVVYISGYNGLTHALTKVEEGWVGIEVQLKRRHELIPQLVSVVKSAMSHEQDIIDKLLSAREAAIAAMASHDPNKVSEAEGALGQALGRFVSFSEDNVEIKATENISKFQSQLEETADQIAAARRLYNGNVQALNARILSFPSNLIAQRHGFKQAQSFSLSDVERKSVEALPDVSLYHGS